MKPSRPSARQSRLSPRAIGLSPRVFKTNPFVLLVYIYTSFKTKPVVLAYFIFPISHTYTIHTLRFWFSSLLQKLAEILFFKLKRLLGTDILECYSRIAAHFSPRFAGIFELHGPRSFLGIYPCVCLIDFEAVDSLLTRLC